MQVVTAFRNFAGFVVLSVLVCHAPPCVATDVRLSAGDREGAGLLEIYNGTEWRAVCADGFGHFEGQVACTQLGYPFVLGIANDTETSITSGVVQSVSCQGPETNVTECIVTTGEQCMTESSGFVELTCDDVHNTTEDLMLILFEEDGCHFTMVAPDSNIYQQNCKYPNGTCSGSHIICPNDLGIPLFLLQALECAEIDLDGIVNCPIVTCLELMDPANGTVDDSNREFQNTATYTCDAGFELLGNSMRTCQADGTWSGDEPTCMAPSPGGAIKGSSSFALPLLVALTIVCAKIY